jgi:hypothetical protein
MDYRKFYEEKTGEEIPEGFEVHHLDFDRENNNIKNLVALPSAIHMIYHSCLKEFESIPAIRPEDLIPKSILDHGSGYTQFLFSQISTVIRKINPTMSEITRWISYRDFLLGELPNIFRQERYKDQNI